MPPESSDTAYLWDMLRYARTAMTLVENVSIAAYIEDRTRQLALERALEVVGESAGKVSQAFRADHSEIPWRKIIGLRNVFAHDYGNILQERLWIVAVNHVPELIQSIEPLIPPESTVEE
jgi:uncharacterized protein with HEPN domain